MNFSKGKTRDFYLLTTDVENLFINEYMSDAPGDYVKVYLFGLLYGQHGSEMSHRLLAGQLGLDEKSVAKAWDYWESMGVIKKIPNGSKGMLSYDVEFVNLREKMYSHVAVEEIADSDGEKKADQPLSESSLKELFSFVEDLTGETLSTSEMKDIGSWVIDDHVSINVIKAAVEYCYDQGKKNVKYISKVAEDWHKRGFTTEAECFAFVEESQERLERYRTVLKNLGQYRQPTEAEKKIMAVWFDEMNFSMERVLEACDETAGTSNPNIKYVNKILDTWYKDASREGRDVNRKNRVSQADLKNYFEFLRGKAEKEAKQRKEELYAALPEAKEIDNRIREISSELSRNLLKGLDKSRMEMLRAEMKELETKRAVLLTENNYHADYTEIKYACEKCRDTGFAEDGSKCSCTEQRTKEAELWLRKNQED